MATPDDEISTDQIDTVLSATPDDTMGHEVDLSAATPGEVVAATPDEVEEAATPDVIEPEATPDEEIVDLISTPVAEEATPDAEDEVDAVVSEAFVDGGQKIGQAIRNLFPDFVPVATPES